MDFLHLINCDRVTFTQTVPAHPGHSSATATGSRFVSTFSALSRPEIAAVAERMLLAALTSTVSGYFVRVPTPRYISKLSALTPSPVCLIFIYRLRKNCIYMYKNKSTKVVAWINITDGEAFRS